MKPEPPAGEGFAVILKHRWALELSESPNQTNFIWLINKLAPDVRRNPFILLLVSLRHTHKADHVFMQYISYPLFL